MKILFFFSLMISFSTAAFGNCYEPVARLSAESCKSSKKVGSILSCVNNIGARVNYCKQLLDQKKKTLVLREDKILSDEILKIEKSTHALLVTGVNAKQDVRYTALKQLNEEFMDYSDSLKTAIARTNGAYNEFKMINLRPINESEKLITITKLEKVIKKINIETRNAQVYFDESKAKFLAIEALLQISITEGALAPVRNLKNQNDIVVTYIQEALNLLKIPTDHNNKKIEINFPASLEKLVRDSENQEVAIEACRNNSSKECKELIMINHSYHEEVAKKILSSNVQVESMKNIELKNKIIESQAKNNLIEYGRFYDLAIAAGLIE